MAIVNGYATLPEVRGQLKLPEPSEFDARLENVVTSVSRWIDRECERHFWADGTVGSPVARFFDACNPTTLRLGVFNDLAEVTEVATGTDGTYGDVWDASEFQLLPLRSGNGAPQPEPFRYIRAVGRTFPRPTSSGRVGLVRVTGVWGWPEVPGQVREACLIQVARIFKRRDAPEGVMGFDQFGGIRVSGRPDPDVMQMLDPLVHPDAVKMA